MADIAAVVIQTLQWVGAPVIRQFQYLCCFSRNITNLRNETNQLEGATQDLQGKVDRAKNDLRVISSGVEIWLQNSNDIENETRGILDEVSNVESGCLKLGARFFLSRRAKKTTDRVKEVRGQCNFHDDAISQPAPAAATQPIPSGITYKFKSRKKIEEDIMATLRGGDVNMMGIHGMGGLGKTTMAKNIMNRARDENLFDEIVITVVSQQIDELKIQLEIGGLLGLNITKEEAPHARVQKLNARLRGTKRILIVLDDVWESLILEDIGIPSDYKECTILLTSRNHDVLRAMDVQKIFGMEVLSEEDSWIMFRDRVGTCVDNTKLNSLARKVVNECKGLPLALTTVGAALKDEVDVKAWKNAVGRLEKGDPDIPQFIAKVYSPLKLSYDVLEPKYQDVFLLCCVYPEDADIPLEQLTYFCMGLCIATGSVEEARNRIHALTKVLKNRSLLLDSEKGDEYVRMHDVVRDVCVFIAKHEGYIGDNDLTSSLQRYKLHSGFELLQIRNSDEEINFHGITNLYVLSMERCSQLTSLPFTQRPNNLITLVLDSCKGLETLSVVGELVNLEILICRHCYSVKELPPEICDDRISSNSFQNLKILKLDDLPLLKQLWMSSQNDFLPQLEDLSIWNCGMMETVFLWKGEDGNENTSCHHITKIFPKLEVLWLVNLPNLISLCQGIEGIEFPLMRRMEIEDCGKIKGMVWNEKISGGSSNNASIHALFFPQEVSFAELEVLIISGCQGILSLFTSSMAGNLLNLKELEISECYEMVEVIKDDEEKGMSGGRQTDLLFPKLHTLKLEYLPKLVSFCDLKGIESIQFPVCGKMKGMVANGVTSNENKSGGSSTNAADIIHLFCQSKQVSFGCLKELYSDRNPFCSHTIHVSIFDRLEGLTISVYKGSMSLFSSSITGNLVNLTTLTITFCPKMVKVIEEKEEEKEKVVSGAQRTTILFPKLHKILLWILPELVRFCEWKCDVELPSLTRVEIGYCHKMKSCTAGLLTTPNLKSVKIDDEEFGEVKDLNGLVQQQYLRRAEETTDVATQKEAPAAAAK